MTEEMDATQTMSESEARDEAAMRRLLRHCQALGAVEYRIPARTRLELAIGPELARQLVVGLTAGSRR